MKLGQDLDWEKNIKKAVIISENQFILSFVNPNDDGYPPQNNLKMSNDSNDLPADFISVLSILETQIRFLIYHTLEQGITSKDDEVIFAKEFCRKYSWVSRYIEPDDITADWFDSDTGPECAFETLIPRIGEILGYIICPQAVYNIACSLCLFRLGPVNIDIYYLMQ